MKVLFDYEEVIDNPVICYILERACKTLKVYHEFEVLDNASVHFKIKARDEQLLEQVFIRADKEYRVDPDPFDLKKWLTTMRCKCAQRILSYA